MIHDLVGHDVSLPLAYALIVLDGRVRPTRGTFVLDHKRDIEPRELVAVANLELRAQRRAVIPYPGLVAIDGPERVVRFNRM